MSEISKIPWPPSPSEYEIKRTVGHGATSLVHTAYCKLKNENVAVKIIDFEQSNNVIEEIQKEIQAMHLCHHENVVSYYTSFVKDTELWIIMKLMDAGSVLDLISKIKKHPDVNPTNGIMNETLIITILREVLKALEYFHSKGQIHRDVKAGNILISTDGSVRLADFGVSAVIMDYEDRKKIRKTFVGTPCWMAPEVMEQTSGYNYKADIWSLGITALEMATGEAPYARYPAMKVLVHTLNDPPPTLETCASGQKDMFKQYSKEFRKFVSQCLQKDPSLRPDAGELLRSKIFKNARDKSYMAQQFSYYNATLIDRSYHMKPQQTRPEQQWHKDPSGFWIWPENTESTTSSELASLPSGVGGNNTKTTEPSESVENSQKTSVILRIRNKFGDVIDIYFPYDCTVDKPENVVQEMIAADLVNGQDWICISAQLHKLLYEDVNTKCITFPLKSTPLDGASPNEETLVGYAQILLQDKC